jgi:hypothetical protein
MRRERRTAASADVPTEQLWTYDGVTAAEGRQIVALLNRLADRAREGHATQAIELAYHGREGWVVCGVGIMPTDDVDELAADASTRAHARLIDALEEAWQRLTVPREDER